MVIDLCATPITGTATAWTRLRSKSSPLNAFRCPTSRPQRALQVSLSTATARKLLVTLRLRLCAIAASNWSSTGGLWYYPLRRETFFVILVATVYSVMPLQKVPTKSSASRSLQKGTQTGTYRRAKLMWHVKHLNGLTLVSVEHISSKFAKKARWNLRVRICLSRCSSLVKDCPQYVQNTILKGSATQGLRVEVLIDDDRCPIECCSQNTAMLARAVERWIFGLQKTVDDAIEWEAEGMYRCQWTEMIPLLVGSVGQPGSG